MARRRSLSSQLFRTARIVDDFEAAASGNPRRIRRRAVNVAKGRVLGRAGVWRRLWK
jgi:hypothetical protein